jgi:catechol 2,3-dioxygenase-like lactoylglutathione lyase family enzyme
MKTSHVAVAVSNIEQSVADYSARLGLLPVLIVAGEYALLRTGTLNLSIRKTNELSGTLRHLGREDAEAAEFSVETDCNRYCLGEISRIPSGRGNK